MPWMLSVGGDGAVGGFLPWSERPLREVSLASCGYMASCGVFLDLVRQILCPFVQ